MIHSIALNSSLFIIGVAIGSFFNVVACRYQDGARVFDFGIIGGRSRCPKCGKQLHWYELVPFFSFLLQLGRCRGCKKPISWQYPVVEFLGGLALLTPLYFWNYYSFPEHPYRLWLSLVWLLVALAMLLLAVIDWRIYIIPDQINIFLALLGLVFIFLGTNSFLKNYAEWLPISGNISLNHLLGALVGALILGLIVLLSWGRAMGMGDVKLAAVMGLILGWPDIVMALAMAFVVGGFYSFGLLFLKKAGMKTMVPFGPFLVAGFWLHIFFGHQLLQWYFAFI